MENKNKLYIKGCAEGTTASLAFIVTCGDVEVFSKSFLFRDIIRTRNGGTIKILENKAQYQMEILAAACGLYACVNTTDVDIYTNNKAVQRWLETKKAPDDYSDVFALFLQMSANKNINVYQENKGKNENLDLCGVLARNELPCC